MAKAAQTLLYSALVIAFLVIAGYMYLEANAVCKVPISYQIGSIDPRFHITKEEAQAVASRAESKWEDATGRNLFTYDESSTFTIDFIFDERQALTEEEHELREVLERQKDLSDDVKQKYNMLINQYEDLRASYERSRSDYEMRLAAHNKEVEEWNKKGGAPEDVFEELNKQQTALSEEQGALNRMSYRLNQLVDQINELSEEGNVVVNSYNETVESYNEQFAEEEREFTQGDYQGDYINIYQFVDMTELELVLMHEFGHALSLGHVDEPNAIMYFFMKDQDLDEGIQPSDLEEFKAVCGDEEFTLWSIL